MAGLITVYQAITNGQTFVMPANVDILHLLPTTAILGAVITMPASPNNDQVYRVITHNLITGLVFQPNTAQAGVIGAPLVGTANVGYAFQYRMSDTNWYRVY